MIVDQSNHLAVVCNDITQLDAERRGARLPANMFEEREHLVDPPFGPGELPAAGYSPNDLVGEQRTHLIHIAVLQDRVHLSASSCVRISDTSARHTGVRAA